MKKVAIIVVLLIGVGIGISFLLHQPSTGDSTAGTAGSVPSGEPSEDRRSGREAGGENASYRPVENPDLPIVGRKPYDTGIKNDMRVQPNGEGKHVHIEAVQISRGLHSPDSSPEEDLEYLEQILSLYRLSFERNPVAGDNQMVMEALLGANPGDLVVFPADHPALNATGELLDRWGTPYFFHALSGTEMEIFSAGPDRDFNTADDIQRSYRDGQPLTGAELEGEIDVEE